MREKLLSMKQIFYSFLLICLCFTFVSSGYLSWFYHLIEILPNPQSADQASEVFGYLFQAAGIAVFSALAGRFRTIRDSASFLCIILLYMICLIPSVLSQSVTVSLVCGFAMNLFCGIISACYIYTLTIMTDSAMTAQVFGSAYGLSTIITWLASEKHNMLQEDYVLIIYALMAALGVMVYDKCVKRGEETDGLSQLTVHLFKGQSPDNQRAKDIQREEGLSEGHGSLILTAAFTVIMLSFVKSLGFIFPASDISSGISLELSRIFYGVSLIIAGYISDKNRQIGAIFCISSLVLPFIMLVLGRENMPQIILWSMNYFFFGFFTIFRVILFCDLANKTNLYYLAAGGLLTGRIGDAVGTYTYIYLKDNVPILIIVAGTLFVLTMFVFFRLYNMLYLAEPETVILPPQISEEERFELFCKKYDCTLREREILRLITKERTNSEIAKDLFISESTVKFHVRNLLRKTNCGNRVDLIRLFQLSEFEDE